MVAFAHRPKFGQDYEMTATQLITADHLEAMGSDARFELIQGVLYEVSPSSYRSNRPLARIGARLLDYVESHGLGEVSIGEVGYRLEVDPDSVVAPDVAFVAAERTDLAGETGYFPGRPDLAVEVISPTDEPLDMRRKQALYERVGIPLVWWIDPKRHTVSVHALGKPVRVLTEDDRLDGESVVPGFSIQIADLFTAPKATSR